MAADDLTATGIIRQAFAEPTDDQHRPGLVPPARPRLRRRLRDLHLRMPHALAARFGVRLDPRVLAAAIAVPAAWDVAMIALAWSVRY